MWGREARMGTAEPLRMWGVTVPPESPQMKPEEGSSATIVSHVLKVADNQNGSQIM